MHLEDYSSETNDPLEHMIHLMVTGITGQANEVLSTVGKEKSLCLRGKSRASVG